MGAGSLAPTAFPGSLLSTAAEGFPTAVGKLLEKEYGIQTNSKVQKEFTDALRSNIEAEGLAVQPQEVYDAFLSHYIHRTKPLDLRSFTVIEEGDEGIDLACDIDKIHAVLTVKETSTKIEGKGNGPISAFINAL